MSHHKFGEHPEEPEEFGHIPSEQTPETNAGAEPLTPSSFTREPDTEPKPEPNDKVPPVIIGMVVMHQSTPQESLEGPPEIDDSGHESPVEPPSTIAEVMDEGPYDPFDVERFSAEVATPTELAEAVQCLKKAVALKITSNSFIEMPTYRDGKRLTYADFVCNAPDKAASLRLYSDGEITMQVYNKKGEANIVAPSYNYEQDPEHQRVVRYDSVISGEASAYDESVPLPTTYEELEAASRQRAEQRAEGRKLQQEIGLDGPVGPVEAAHMRELIEQAKPFGYSYTKYDILVYSRTRIAEEAGVLLSAGQEEEAQGVLLRLPGYGEAIHCAGIFADKMKLYLETDGQPDCPPIQDLDLHPGTTVHRSFDNQKGVQLEYFVRQQTQTDTAGEQSLTPSVTIERRSILTDAQRQAYSVHGAHDITRLTRLLICEDPLKAPYADEKP